MAYTRASFRLESAIQRIRSTRAFHILGQLNEIGIRTLLIISLLICQSSCVQSVPAYSPRLSTANSVSHKSVRVLKAANTRIISW